MFTIDNQTRLDLSVSSFTVTSILNFFDNTETLGGAHLLKHYFNTPINDIGDIRERQEAILFISKLKLDIFFDKYMMADLENYLTLPGEPYSYSRFDACIQMLSFDFSLAQKRKRFFIKRSICEISELVIKLNALFRSLEKDPSCPNLLKRDIKTYFEIVSSKEFLSCADFNIKTISRSAVRKFDYIFRNEKKVQVRAIFDIIYKLDFLYGISKSLKDHQLCFPEFSEDLDGDILNFEGIYNIFIERSVTNDIKINRNNKIWFLTGANMTGKSTLLKAIGASVYLAHIGFPVPARKMVTRVFNGILTTINLGDDMIQGYSHFLHEVHRIKYIADQLTKNNKILILLDELFKGTNYHDAYEATDELIKSISKLDSAVFIISSHITELGLKLKDIRNVELKYIETTINENDEPVFTYKLKSGLATEKLGMWLLNKERVFDLFKSGLKRSKK